MWWANRHGLGVFVFAVASYTARRVIQKGWYLNYYIPSYELPALRFAMALTLFVARISSPRLVNKVSKNSPFASGAGSLKCVGSVGVTGLVDAVNFTIQPGASKVGRHLLAILV